MYTSVTVPTRSDVFRLARVAVHVRVEVLLVDVRNVEEVAQFDAVHELLQLDPLVEAEGTLGVARFDGFVPVPPVQENQDCCFNENAQRRNQYREDRP